VAAAVVDGQGSIIYTCGVTALGTTGVKNIRIEMSRGSSNSYDRSMRSGAERLRYNIYLDASRTTVWGDGANGTDSYFDSHPPNKRPVTVPAYGRIFAMQDVAAGAYFDVLQVTILF
jgi:spore coat protein U-like protein